MELAALGLKVEGIDNLDKAASSLQKLGAASEQAADGAQELAQATKTLSGVESEFTAKSEKASSSTKRLAEFMDSSIASQKAMDSTLQKLTQTLDEFQKKSAKPPKQEVVDPPLPKVVVPPEAPKELTDFERRAQAAGMSAKQLSAALRNVPAQFTDIAVSLQGGMSPLTVFMQQGGQLKDMFGGAGPAARALGGYIMGLITPMNLAAAGVAALGLAYYQGSKEADNFRLSLITTGNAAGLTVTQLQGMASAISETTGTTGAAAAALATMVSAGVRAESELAKYTETAIRWAKYTGEGVEVVAERFVALQKEPLSAALKLNETTNFLTESVYKQIKALDEQGDTAEAARVAMDAYNSAMEQGAKQIEQNLGYVERAWNAAGGAAKWAWDQFLSIGRQDSITERLSDIDAELEKLSTRSTKAVELRKKALQSERAELVAKAEAESKAAESSKKQAEAVKALSDFDKKYKDALKEQLPLEKVLANARAEAVKFGKSEAEIKKILAFETEKYNKANRGSGGGGRSAGVSELANIQARVAATNQYIKALQEQGAAADKITEGERLAYKIQLEIDSGRLSAAQKAQKIKELAAAKELQAAQEIAAFEKGRVQGEQQNINALTQLAERMQLANLQGVELAKTQALLGLNEYATPEQIKAVEDMAAALYQLDEQNSKRKKFGDNPDKYIMGDVSPLSGGGFDEQLERYEAERERELMRYQEAQDRLVMARELQIETQKSYDQLEEEQAQQHASRLQQIESARYSLMLNTASSSFGSLADVFRTAQGEQSSAYRAMFAVSKAFAVADATMKAYQAISAAWASAPFPANLAAVAMTTPAVLGVVSSLKGTQISGMAHDGIDSIPATGTWLLEKGERVTTANTSARLDSTLERIDSRMNQNGGNIEAAPKVTVQLIGGEFQNATVEEDYDSINEETIIRVVSNDIARRGPITKAGQQYLGWSRVGT